MKKTIENSVIYQIYPKSFKDSNGDGFGDINGVIEKLDYLKKLGVDFLWLTPFYVSPQNDNGYDIADYYQIDPRFGTMDDFERLVKEANARDIDIMLDMVFNHSSTEHQWFQQALKGDAKYKDFYFFKKSEGIPNNWQSKFGGSAWEFSPELGEYYLHLYDKTQADLNWDNPLVREAIYQIVNFWIGKGVKGFRFDVINVISKPDHWEDDHQGDGRRFYTDGPNIHRYLKALNAQTFGRYPDMVTVGEMSSTTIDHCIRYSNPKEKELSMVFNFHHLKVDYDGGDKWSLMDFDFLALKRLFKDWQEKMQQGGGWNALFWCNHDQPRIVSRFGDDKRFHKESATMLACAIHMMRGTPYIYQGEEIGMRNPYFDSIEDYRDVESLNYYQILRAQGKTDPQIMAILQAKSRDNSRTPMQWDDTAYAGFSTTRPWIDVAKDYPEINAANALADPNSIFYFYQQLINLRKRYPIIAHGSFKMLLEDHPQLMVYVRHYEGQDLLVINNFYPQTASLTLDESLFAGREAQLLISNYPDKISLASSMSIQPYASLVYLLG